MKRLVILAMLLVAGAGLAQNTTAGNQSDFDTVRKQADTLYQLGHAAEALPSYERLVQQKPDDMLLQERYGMTLLMSAATVDTEQRKKMRVEAKKALTKARDLGDKSSLMLLINDIPDDGSFASFSDRSDVDSVMQAGEAAYGKGDYAEAIKHYQKALALDPKNYHAALFIGDSNFASGHYDEAGQWFAQAIAIDPNAETAYRYWGDALVKQGKWQDAESKFIAAVIAEPYNQHSWAGLVQWARLHQRSIVVPNIVPPNKVEDNDKGGATITIDAQSLGGDRGKDVNPAAAAWLVYPMTHVLWKKEGSFKKKYPSEQDYRHSLAEEVEAFTKVITVYSELTTKKKPAEIDPQIAKLIDLQQHGSLESYILLNRADAGLAQDYPAYRENHRENLRDYLESCIVSQPQNSLPSLGNE